MKVLLAVDGSAFSEVATKSVASRPWPPDSEVKIITVIEPLRFYVTEPPTLPDGYWEELEKSLRQEASNVIEMATEKFAGAQGLTISSEILKGIPKEAIVEEAEAWGADLIVMGSHRYTGLKRMFLGSVSHAVMTHARCSVEIVRSREAGHEAAP